jgi:hypothetical protein
MSREDLDPLKRQLHPTIFSREIGVKLIAGSTLQATINLPKPIRTWWRLIDSETHLDIETFGDGEHEPEYAIMRPAPDGVNGRRGERYKISSGRVSLPKNFLSRIREAGHSIDARVIQLGYVSVISSLDQLGKQVRGVSARDPTGTASGITAEQLEAVTREIEDAPNTAARVATALTPVIFCELFPTAAPYISSTARVGYFES